MSANGRAHLRVLLIGSFVLVGSGGGAPSAMAAPLLVGVAKLDLTPPVATPLAGYSRRKGQSASGVHDSPFVRAVVIRQADREVAMVSCDLLIVDERLAEAVRRLVEKRRPGASPMLFLAATHTHSGPGGYGQKFLEKLSMGHFNPSVFDFLTAQIAEAILSASARLQPATVSYAATSTSGLVVNRMDPGGVVDPELIVVTFHDAQRQPLGVVVSFNAHPTTLGSWNMALSADYPGVVTRVVEQQAPGAICMFLAGAVGDQGPVKMGAGFEPAERLGGALAAQVVRLMDPRGREPDADTRALGWVMQRVRLPAAHLRVGSGQLPAWLSRLFVDDDATLEVAAIGTTLFMGAPCDLSAELGLELKRAARERGYQPVVVGFANDYIGYCLPERLYETDSYEAAMAFNGPKTGEMLVGELKQMIDQLSTAHE